MERWRIPVASEKTTWIEGWVTVDADNVRAAEELAAIAARAEQVEDATETEPEYTAWQIDEGRDPELVIAPDGVGDGAVVFENGGAR